MRILQWHVNPAHPDTIALRRPAVPVPETLFGTELLRGIIQQMGDTMYEARGQGIAATQIADWPTPMAIFLLMYREDRAVAHCNPVISNVRADRIAVNDACLSFASIPVRVTVPAGLTVTFRDMHGNEHSESVAGGLAHAIYHEERHLRGKLLIDQLPKGSTSRIVFLRELEKARKKAERKEAEARRNAQTPKAVDPRGEVATIEGAGR